MKLLACLLLGLDLLSSKPCSSELTRGQCRVSMEGAGLSCDPFPGTLEVHSIHFLSIISSRPQVYSSGNTPTKTQKPAPCQQKMSFSKGKLI